MGLRSDPGEIWNLITYLYNFRDDVCDELTSDLTVSKSMREKLLDLCNSKDAVKIAEDIEEQEKLLVAKRKKFSKSCIKMIRKLHEFLLYIESIGTERTSMEHCSGNGSTKGTDAGGMNEGDTVIFRGIEFKGIDSFEVTEENLGRMDNGHAPVGKDGLYINLHHSLQTEDGPIWELSQTKHKKWHRALHINPSTMPSGINRSAFSMLRKDYWRNRADRIRRFRGG